MWLILFVYLLGTDIELQKTHRLVGIVEALAHLLGLLGLFFILNKVTPSPNVQHLPLWE
jgi:hypothetical protein